MYIFRKPYSDNFISCRKRVIFLAFLWVCTLLLGVILARVLCGRTFSLMHTVIDSGVSIVPVILVRFFPLIVSAILAFFFSNKYIPIVAFFRAICYGFCSGCIYIIFGKAGWLLHLLIMFSGALANVALLFFWLHILVSARRIGTAFFISGAVILFSIVIEALFVYPVLATLKL